MSNEPPYNVILLLLYTNRMCTYYQMEGPLRPGCLVYEQKETRPYFTTRLL